MNKRPLSQSDARKGRNSLPAPSRKEMNKRPLHWKRTPSSPTELAELSECADLIMGLKFIDSHNKRIRMCDTIGVKWIPKNVNVFAWQACLNRILSRMALARRNVFLPSTSCAICNSALKYADHLQISCRFASKEYTKMVVCIISSTLWFLWKERNDNIFNNMIKTPNNTVEPSSGHHQTYSSSPLRPADHYRDEGYLLLEPNLCCQPHHHQRLSRTRSMTRKEGILESGMFISLVAIVSSNWHPTTVNRVSVADGG
ncbi:hypothetical protein E3N88_20148 [Mikania micrantha]|uniref:Reverse transcriptase zinc-binding domain-containing protein n=1 Tax=Mikania micrantha TaxID=192012 RepID=A0A5N6NIS9_9ASTR|nr:hypothetical protein E3N88_20148 [Mikania micrantha]